MQPHSASLMDTMGKALFQDLQPLGQKSQLPAVLRWGVQMYGWCLFQESTTTLV